MSNHAIDQSKPFSFGCVEDVAEEEQLFCLWPSHIMTQQPGRAEVTAEADLRISRPELRLVGGYAQVAGQTDAGAGGLATDAVDAIAGFTAAMVTLGML